MTSAKKLNPRDRALKALKDSRLDPGKTGIFFKELAAYRLTYCGHLLEPAEGRKKHKFLPLILSPEGPAGQADEFIPFFLSLAEAGQKVQELGIEDTDLLFQTSSPAKVFNLILESGKTPCLFLGGEDARTFSVGETREVIRLAERPKIPPHIKTKAWKEYVRLKYAYARESAGKAASRQPSPTAPALAKFLIMAEQSLKARLSFPTEFKKSFMGLQDRGDENFIELAWNMLWSLAHVYHIFHFSGKDYPPEGFLEETGLAVAPAVLPTEPPEKIKSAVLMIFDPKKKEGLRIYFTVPERKQKIMLLEAGQTQGCGHRPQTP